MYYSFDFFIYKDGSWTNQYADGQFFYKAIQMPLNIHEKLNDTLDTAYITFNLPLKTPYQPRTKVMVHVWDNGKMQGSPADVWHMIIEKDNVETIRGVKGLYIHRIQLIEASAAAQAMHVDSIALTYKLKDVDMNYETIPAPETHDFVIVDESNDGELRIAERQTDRTTMPPLLDKPVGSDSDMDETFNHFTNSYRYRWRGDSLIGQYGIKGLRQIYEASVKNAINFKIPRLYIEGRVNSGEWESLFELPVSVLVSKRLYQNDNLIENEPIIDFINYPNTLPVTENDCFYSDGSSAGIRVINGWIDRRDSVPSIGAQAVLSSMHVPQFSEQMGTTQLSRTGEHYDDYGFETSTLSAEMLDAGYRIEYDFFFTALSFQSINMPILYDFVHHGLIVVRREGVGFDNWVYDFLTHGYLDKSEYVSNQSIAVTTGIKCVNTLISSYINFLKQPPKPYDAYSLIRKAFLACDAYVIDTAATGLDNMQYPIEIDPYWIGRLEQTTIFETTFEQKNLWEVLLQVGKYLHAIPYLEHSEDGDRFILKFRQLGDSAVQPDSGNPLTIFSSQGLSEYFASFDSYVTNFYSPQNVVEEYLVPKTSDSSFLISNNTTELHTTKPIIEVEQFFVTYNGENGGQDGTKNITKRLFERNIYDILTNHNPKMLTPTKGDSLFYTLGDNKIMGLTYVAPTVNSGDLPMSMQQIIAEEFTASGSAVKPFEIKMNNLLFKIRYRTYDTARISQFRPDLFTYVKNSSLESYPKHEQFFGQQDKIVDSERYSANLFGQLVRTGNTVIQTQEKVTNRVGKTCGELYLIDGDPYYITEVDSDLYPAVMMQKITLSKNFNEISQVVTIPSEPRFYEVSERGHVRREVKMQEFLRLSGEPLSGSARFINVGKVQDLITQNMLGKSEFKPPNYAFTRFMADKRRHSDEDAAVLFPSSETERVDDNSVRPKSSSDHADCIVPVLVYPMRNGITFEWDMADNFKAGDFVDTEISGETGTTAVELVNGAYYAQQPVRVCDWHGRADLMQFELFRVEDVDIGKARALPKAASFNRGDAFAGVSGTNAVALDKDNREAISCNLQINLLYDTNEFVTFSNLFGVKDSELKIALLDRKVGMFDEVVPMQNALPDDITVTASNTESGVRITINAAPDAGTLAKVKSIALYQDNDTFGRHCYIARNVEDFSDSEKLDDWFISALQFLK